MPLVCVGGEASVKIYRNSLPTNVQSIHYIVNALVVGKSEPLVSSGLAIYDIIPPPVKAGGD